MIIVGAYFFDTRSHKTFDTVLAQKEQEINDLRSALAADHGRDEIENKYICKTQQQIQDEHNRDRAPKGIP